MALPTWLFPRTRSLWYGVTLPFTALKLICSRPVLIFWSLLPVGLTLSIYGFVILRLQETARGAVSGNFQNWGWSPDGWAAWVTLLLTRIILLLVGAVTFSLVASVVASPFNDFLAEKSERWAEPALPAVADSSLAHKIRLILIDLLKAVAATLATLVALLISWIPGINLVAFALAFLLVSFQYISYPQTRRGLGVRAGLAFLWRHAFACLGFGAVISTLFAIPLVSSLAVPLAVVGGTLLVARAQGTPRLR